MEFAHTYISDNSAHLYITQQISLQIKKDLEKGEILRERYIDETHQYSRFTKERSVPCLKNQLRF